MFKNSFRSNVKEPFFKLLQIYAVSVAPFLAAHTKWLYWPIYKILKMNNVCFIANLGGGVGHIIIELDHFFRLLKTKEISSKKKYVWLSVPNEFSKTCIELYQGYFWQVSHNRFLYYFFLPIIMGYKDLTIDVGLSRLKWQLINGKKNCKPLSGQSYINQISKNEWQTQWLDYYKMRQKCSEYFPLKKRNIDYRYLLKELKLNEKKIALIHLKQTAINATACPTDPKTYIDALTYLKDKNFQIVFVGREKMPKIFKKFEMINYPASPAVSFKSDIALFHLADLSIIAGSGLSCLADCFDKPYLYINYWHLAFSMFLKKCLGVPALVQKKNNEFLKFSEQINLYSSLPDIGAEIFPADLYKVRNTSSDEILAALQELLEMKNENFKNSDFQNKIRTVSREYPIYYAQSKISDYFLKKHQALLG
ncbi:MAG: TIGR04372 family glycosyltransferase [Chlamydiae bacterium]|nr:TIGR04372 family glycosyltransferase [Chlamydiota bacterium]